MLWVEQGHDGKPLVYEKFQADGQNENGCKTWEASRRKMLQVLKPNQSPNSSSIVVMLQNFPKQS
ncbi:MAG: hypothetical protein Kow00121_47810 [Elainellaceae cyanobacterium]